MASQPLHLSAVPSTPVLPSFDEALARICNLRTSIMLIASPAAERTEMRLCFHEDKPAFEITITLRPFVDPLRTVFTLEDNPLTEYRIIKVQQRPAAGSTSRWIVSAIVVPA